MIASFLAGGNLTALVKSKQGSSLDIRPIAVGEALRRLIGKCLCALVRSKASEFFNHTSLGWHVLWEQKRLCMVLERVSKSIGRKKTL